MRTGVLTRISTVPISHCRFYTFVVPLFECGPSETAQVS